MPRKAPKATPPAAHAVGITDSDRAMLVEAYKTGLITAWKHDGERSYRLTLRDRRDENVDVAKLTSYIEGLRRNAA
jgi:hypothetical protein